MEWEIYIRVFFYTIKIILGKKGYIMLRPSVFHENFVDNIFDHFFQDSFWKPTGMRTVNTISTDVKELENSYQIDMELPGFNKEDVKVTLEDGYLTVQAKRLEEKKDSSNEKYIRRERYSGQYQRSFYLGKQVTEEEIKAKFKDGILTLDIPKKSPQIQEKNKKYISIEE